MKARLRKKKIKKMLEGIKQQMLRLGIKSLTVDKDKEQ